jgi:hypothetical protein
MITFANEPYGKATDATKLFVTTYSQTLGGAIYEAPSISTPLSLDSSSFTTVDPGVSVPISIATDGTYDYISALPPGAVFEGFGTGA